MQFDELRAEVGAWSGRNFGDQHGLNEVAPLLGIVEEIGELIDAGTRDGVEDAFADMIIFLADLCERADLKTIYLPPTQGEGDGYPSGRSSILELFSAVAAVSHIILKRRQRIRGYENEAYYKQSLWDAVHGLVGRICYAYRCNSSGSLIDTVEKTWEKVKQRDWTKTSRAEESAVSTTEALRDAG